MTVESDREDVRRVLTPSTTPFAARLRALRKLRDAGIETQIAVSPLLPHSADFARKLAGTSHRVIVDDYFRGDGSGGKRSLSIGMRAAYEEAGWDEWHSPQPADALLQELQTMLPPESVGFSIEGFAPPDR